MTYEGELTDPTGMSPDEAFDVLGNETRIRILRALGEAEGPLSFTELRERLDIRQGGRFNYHLDKLVGHFVAKGDDGYELRQAGRRVVQAVLSEAVTDAPVLERTEVDRTCHHCGAPVEVRYHEGHIEMFCTECSGTWDRDGPVDGGYLGCLVLPPAGLEGRTTEEALRAGRTWNRLRLLAVASGLCPRCSAALDRSVDVCGDHDEREGICDECGRRHAVQATYECTNCIFDAAGTYSVALLANTDLLAFLTTHGLNPVSPDPDSDLPAVLGGYDEVVRSTDPFVAEFTFSVDGDTLTLLVDDDLDVVEVRHSLAATIGAD